MNDYLLNFDVFEYLNDGWRAFAMIIVVALATMYLIYYYLKPDAFRKPL